ncbi:hypothetical protein O6R08_02190 [Cutibacterium equinum]|uniref:Methylamine utilisation protein MauE domain-containing protein n=1 Tax=Cutibacterium equinum TaxID=3016342 RepID=A0ABY7QZ89_9ACTN|nr:MauE/DoxX family redox-associated membrane protein [Cutibacterium equinum]WCC80365.1 hypothetical protein O6R08_02190 [Cutibacterium equinum]
MTSVLSGLTLCAVLAAVVLLVSGVGKAQSDHGVGEALDALGLPGSQLPSGVLSVLPWAEIVLAALLLVVGGVFGIVVASCTVALFCFYLVVIIRAVVTIPDPVDCHCFGDLAPGDIGARTIVRNILLVAVSVLALIAAIDDRRPVVERIIKASAGDLWWWLAAVLTVAVVATVLYRPVDEDAAGNDAEEIADYESVPIPLASATDAEGRTTTLRGLVSQRPALLLFVSPGCVPCETVLTKAPGWMRLLPEVDVRCLVRSEASRQALPESLRPLSLVDEEGSTALVFEVRGYPTAWLLGVDGRVAGGPQRGPANIETMVQDMRVALDDVASELAESGADEVLVD